ncbi:MAG TPA: SAM-dependent DNA methyltransferase [Pseudoalteromonas sp.]|uniref:site-specific DNA-methyltransferase (adenine-specific) n=2 Tax=root TaxID=1 RepID=A0A0F9VEI3_9ZZZZ|nr:DNA methyltransferase [Pseudoalteromonas sp.]HDY93538.1 SAM-dependent DNA methyltransferase [Pseudoalteromonas sp.]HDZ32642.1 SAM-dependent DNA methyltransferase [Pseudoalteromonas sp.]
MRKPLDKTLRGKLEKTVEKARDIVEVAVTEALTRLGISDGNAPSYLSESERKLRTRLRAHGRQLGDVLNRDTGKQETELLVNEMAYEHWHRMLFARFLEQSDLLMYDQNTHVSLDECFELAEEEPDPVTGRADGWELAGQLAQKMLPQIFRADSPVFEVKLSINHVNDLEELIADLHTDTFQASDALGWCYQFWQNKKKKQVNESGVKIGAKELSPVTQLFTEPYMVSFLLDNALGAWWAKRRLTQDDLATASSEQELRDLASIPGVPLEYLRFVQDEETKTWICAAGDFDKWPDDLSEFKTLDPCCGSGHFLVAKFLMLVPIRMELEGITAKQAIDKVLSQNIHGLELDQRCVELAAFALALEAWRYPGAGGYRVLPELQLACSGMSITEAQKEWKNLAKDDEELQSAIKWMQETFKDAPTIGSLIKPRVIIDDYSTKPWEQIQQAVKYQLSTKSEAIAMSQGLSKVAGVLTNQYSWVITNPPYLKRGKQSKVLQSFVEKKYPLSKDELATTFLERATEMILPSGYISYVIPQYWAFHGRSKALRNNLIKNISIEINSVLGSGAFESISGEVVNVGLYGFSNIPPSVNSQIKCIDVSDIKASYEKDQELKKTNIIFLNQFAQLHNPDGRIIIGEASKYPSLSEMAESSGGMQTFDKQRFISGFYEFKTGECQWDYLQGTVNTTEFFSGREQVVLWESGKGKLFDYIEALAKQGYTSGVWKAGSQIWGGSGVLFKLMGEKLECNLYTGQAFENTAGVITAKEQSDLPAIWAYCQSKEFSLEVRKIDKKLAVTNGNLVKIPFEHSYWTVRAAKLYPKGLPLSFSNQSNQWNFHGHPCASVIWDEEIKTTAISELRQDDTVLQVAVARLLGYRWPAELDTEMELAPEMREIIAQNKVFDGLVDDDGIVCIPAIRGEKPAVDRLEAILHAAYGDKWSATVLNNLLKSVKSRDLNIWLRDKFFEQHCKLFQHRPFIWHIWDGLPDGFSALVNYHQLDYKGLERLIYTYLDDWISTQIQLEKDGDEGAELRLAAARNLRKQLQDILIGEKGLDIFVRWKSLAEQPIGWNPDLNDGVRLNIRPFMKAKDVGKKDAGILRSKPNIHWKKDRGTDVASAPWYDLGLEHGGKQGDRINDHHLTLAEKTAARDKV